MSRLAVGIFDNTAVDKIYNMKAQLLMDEREALSDNAFVERVVWNVAERVAGSTHTYKYRLAFVVKGTCVLRYDNEAGKGDHRHMGDDQQPYMFSTVDRLLADFWKEVDEWRP